MTDSLDGVWFCVMVGVASVVVAVGTVGNSLTLLAIPYVRHHYPTEFSILQLPVTDLLINLSVCDLIYCAFGLPHMIHGMVAGEDPYRKWPSLELTENWSLDFCLIQGTVRNMAVIADFNTMGAISCFIASYHLCRQCREDGGPTRHSDHGRTALGQAGARLVILGIWAISVIAVSPDVTGQLGHYNWTEGVFGCDAVYAQEDGFYSTNYGYPILVVTNLGLMLGSYGLVFWQMKRSHGEDGPRLQRQSSQTVSVTRMMLLLSLTYAVCILPAMTYSWGLWNTGDPSTITNVSTCLYWCMYGINFVLYLTTSSRMRDVYRQFLRDIFTKPVCRPVPRLRPGRGTITSLASSVPQGGATDHSKPEIWTVSRNFDSCTVTTECESSLSTLSS